MYIETEQQEFVNYRNDLLKLRKEALREQRRDKMKKLFNRINDSIGFFLITLVLGIVLFSLGYKIISYEAKLEANAIQIDKLLDANNDLAAKVVELTENKRQQVNIIQNYILRHYRTVPPIVAKNIARNVVIASEKYKLPIPTIMGVMERESQFNPTAYNKSGARGLMQVMPLWVKELGLSSRYELHAVDTNIDSGAYVLRHYLEKKNNDMKKALFKYVGGDSSYVKDVYNLTAKFVVFEELSQENRIVKEVIKEEPKVQLDDPTDEIIKTVKFVHTVIEGDTLSLIAQKYSGNILDWTKIHKLNPKIVPKKMRIGTKVIIPIEMQPKNT